MKFLGYKIPILFSLIALILIMKSGLVKKIEYNNIIKQYQQVSVHDIYNFQKNNEVFFLYTGRSSCPYCRDFIKVLNSSIEQNKLEPAIYILDSSDYKTDNDLILFREVYSIETVPSLIYFDGLKLSKRMDISNTISEKELLDFFIGIE